MPRILVANFILTGQGQRKYLMLGCSMSKAIIEISVSELFFFSVAHMYYLILVRQCLSLKIRILQGDKVVYH